MIKLLRINKRIKKYKIKYSKILNKHKKQQMRKALKDCKQKMMITLLLKWIKKIVLEVKRKKLI